MNVEFILLLFYYWSTVLGVIECFDFFHWGQIVWELVDKVWFAMVLFFFNYGP
jgi:hypothetical protein